MYKKQQNIETFEQEYSNTLKKINNDIKNLNTKYLDVYSQVMNNYKIKCPKTKVKKQVKKKAPEQITQEDELNNVINSLVKMQEYTKKYTKPKKIQKPLVTKPRRLDYNTIQKEIIKLSKLADIGDMEDVPQRMSDEIKLRNYVKCYNEKINSNKKYR